MGACVSACATGGHGDADVARDPSRRRSRSRGKSSYAFLNYSSHRGSIAGSSVMGPPVPDFGIGSLYRVLQLLGEGGTGQTWLCQDARTARRVAIKFIPRPLAKVLVPMVSQEIQLQASLSEGHLGLVRMESALLTKSHLGLVMEYVDGGNLTQYVTRRTSTRFERGGLHLVEDEARYFFRQLINCVEYLHKSHVAHRDLKMCNVVLTTRRPPALKLCDFGFAKGWDENSVMHTRIGTPVYMSPQLISSKQDGKAYSATASDVWACGVMLFAMMLGRFPYDHTGHPDPNSSEAHVEVLQEQLRASGSGWEMAPRVAPHIALLSDDCRDLLGQLLNTDEAQRINIPAIRKHRWFTSELPDHLAEALKDGDERQERLDEVMGGEHEEQVKKRNTAIHDLVLMAGHEYGTAAGGGAGGAGAAMGPHAGPFSAIFECGSEGECPATPPLSQRYVGGGVGSSTLQKVSSKAGTSVCGGGGLSPAPSVRGGRASDAEADVIVVDLAAVARRTKSDGLVLLAPSHSMLAEVMGEADSGEDTEADNSNGGPSPSPGAGSSGVDGGGATERALQDGAQQPGDGTHAAEQGVVPEVQAAPAASPFVSSGPAVPPSTAPVAPVVSSASGPRCDVPSPFATAQRRK